MVGFTAFNPYISITGAVFLFVALGAPIYYFTGVYTVPEYLSKRYNEGTSLAGSIALLLFLLAILAFNIYAFSVFCRGVFGWPIMGTILVVSATIAVYSCIGGVVSVITVDVLQAVFIVFGCLMVAGLGISKVGGIGEMVRYTPQENMSYTTAYNDPGYPAIGMWMGISIIVFAFYLMHQGVLQKCLAARSMNGTRMTMAVYGVILLPFACIFCGLTGVILRSLVEKGIVPAPTDTSFALGYLLTSVVPHGLLGLVAAGYFAAMFSTSDSYVNSATTVLINDIYRKVVKDKADGHYLLLARVLTVVVAIGVPFIFVNYFMNIPYLIAAFYSITSSVVPGLLVAVIMGMGTRKFKAIAATASIVAGMVGTFLSVWFPAIFLAPFCWGITYTDPGASWFQTVAGFCWAMIAAIIFSFVPEKPKTEVELFGLVRNLPCRQIAHDAYFYGLTKNLKGIDILSDDDKRRYLALNEKYLKENY
jgi:SSS family solute:Na+ symporter